MNVFENIPAESEFRLDMTLTTEDGDLVIDQDTSLGELLSDDMFQEMGREADFILGETPLGEFYGSGEDNE